MPSTHYTLKPKPRTGGDLTPDQRQTIIFELEIVRGELLSALANIDRLIDQWTSATIALPHKRRRTAALPHARHLVIIRGKPMNNLLYLAENKGMFTRYCGGRGYLNAIYLEDSATGWHVMIEEQCRDCDRLDTTDIPLDDIQKMDLRPDRAGRSAAVRSGCWLINLDNQIYQRGRRARSGSPAVQRKHYKPVA